MEEKKHRSVQEIQGEYQNLCAKAGHIQYSIKCFQDDLALVNNSLKELNLEAAASSRADAEKAKESKSAENVVTLDTNKKEEQNAQS